MPLIRRRENLKRKKIIFAIFFRNLNFKKRTLKQEIKLKNGTIFRININKLHYLEKERIVVDFLKSNLINGV